MALLNHFTATCVRSFHGSALNKQLFFALRAFHKSASSNVLGISEERAESPAFVEETTRVKTLKEMPGPSTITNLVEFFWRDGFSRIHEIQVMMTISFIFQMPYLVMFDFISFSSLASDKLLP